MKYILLFCVSVVLYGCATTPTPVTQKFPEVPKILLEKCPPLEKIKGEEVVLSEFIKIVTKNYTAYHGCAKMLEGWQYWYKEQLLISDELNKVK